jgi:hypothetical protein
LDTASRVSAVALELEMDCILVLRGREGKREEEEEDMKRKSFRDGAGEVQKERREECRDRKR